MFEKCLFLAASAQIHVIVIIGFDIRLTLDKLVLKMQTTDYSLTNQDGV